MAVAEHVVRCLLGEAALPVDPAEIDEIVRILRSNSDIARLNARLAPHSVSIEWNEEVDKVGAPGGWSGEKMIVNPKMLRVLQAYPDSLRELISHELVHREQSQRVQAAGKDPVEIATQTSDRYMPTGNEPVDVNAYLEEPAEAMALAKNAVDKMRSQGYNQIQMKELLRRGHARRASPVRITGKGQRFHKYAYQYANREEK